MNTNEYICRKGYPALNTQFICLPDHRFSSLVVKWPGSCHDSRIFNESAIKTYMQNGDHGVLLGDSGYANRRYKTYMLTPFLNPQDGPQQRYNSSHCRTRVKIEQSFGILKNRFGALLIPLRMTPERAVSVIIACAVLHNIAILKRDNFLPLVEDDDHHLDRNIYDENDAPAGLATRQYFANCFFT